MSGSKQMYTGKEDTFWIFLQLLGKLAQYLDVDNVRRYCFRTLRLFSLSVYCVGCFVYRATPFVIVVFHDSKVS